MHPRLLINKLVQYTSHLEHARCTVQLLIILAAGDAAPDNTCECFKGPMPVLQCDITTAMLTSAGLHLTLNARGAFPEAREG